MHEDSFDSFIGDICSAFEKNVWHKKEKVIHRGFVTKPFADFVGDEYPDAVVIDPSAASFKVVLRGKGFRTRDADNDVNNGIRHVAMLMARKTLRINKRCENLIKEIHSYCWDEKAAEHGEEKPVKVSDHAADALRYVCNTMLNKWRYA